MCKFNLVLSTFLLFVIMPAYSQQNDALPEGIMLTRGDGVVSKHMFDARIAKIPEKDRSDFLRNEERLKNILGDLALTSQLVAAAREAEFDKGEVKYRMQYAADLLLGNAWLEHYVESYPDADYHALAMEYYILNKGSFMTEPRRDVSQILVSSEERTVEEAKTLAQTYLDQLILTPEEFDKMALQHSEDPSVTSNKGHFKDVGPGKMVKPFEDAAFALEKPGDISGLVQSSFGFHIIRLDKIDPIRQRSFEEVQKPLETVQKNKHIERLRYDYLSELSMMKFRISDTEIKAMVVRYFDEDELSEQPSTPDSE